MPKLTKAGKVDRRTITYALLEFTLNGQYHGRSYPRESIPGLLEWCKSQGLTNVCVNDEIVWLNDTEIGWKP